MASFINATIDVHDFDALLENMRERSVNLKPILSVIGNIAAKSVRQNFREGGRPDRWQPSKKAKGKTLIGTGALMKGIHYKTDELGVTVMTSKLPYAAIHNFGGETKPHIIRAKNAKAIPLKIGGATIFRKEVHHPGSKIPARPYMLLQDEDIKVVGNTLVQYLFENT